MKKIIAVFVLVCVISSFSIQVFGSTVPDYQNEAVKLKGLGLFQGGSMGFELDRVPSRIEAAVMLVRLLGRESEVKQGKYKHPFTDVPKWADTYIGYMYEKGLTEGIGKGLYGSQQSMDINSYVTFILRSIGYDDKKGDFSWKTAVTKCVEVGLIDNKDAVRLSGTNTSFLRDDMVHISYVALQQPLKDGSKTLAQKLYEEKVFTAEQAASAGLSLPGKENARVETQMKSDQTDQTDKMADKIAAYSKLPALTQGFRIVGTNGSAMLVLDPANLPAELKNAVYVSFGSTGEPTFNETLIKLQITQTEFYNYTVLKGKVIGLQTMIKEGTNGYITLYDSNKKLLSAVVVPPSSFVSSDPHCVSFLGDVYNNTMIGTVDFSVKKYIKSVEDTTFKSNVGFGTLYTGKDPARFMWGPIFKEDDTVTFEFTSKNPDLRNIRMQ